MNHMYVTFSPYIQVGHWEMSVERLCIVPHVSQLIEALDIRSQGITVAGE